VHQPEGRRSAALAPRSARGIDTVARYAIPIASCGLALLVTLLLAERLTQVIFVFF